MGWEEERRDGSSTGWTPWHRERRRLTTRLRTGFLFYGAVVLGFSVFMIYFIAPRYGKKNPMIYISICSTVGSISIMAIKGLGIALKLTFRGENQFTQPSTYVFAIMVVVCILTQMNYFNKALSQFSTNMYVPPSLHSPQPQSPTR